MIVEITDENGALVGEFDSPAAPREGETIYYDEGFYEITKVRWDVSENNEVLEKFSVLVNQIEGE